MALDPKKPFNLMNIESDRHLCEFGGVVYGSKCNSKRHQRVAYVKYCDYECKHCFKTFNRIGNICRHRKGKHQDIPGQQINRPYPLLTVNTPEMHIEWVHRLVQVPQWPYDIKAPTSCSYIYQQTFSSHQEPLPWVPQSTQRPLLMGLSHTDPCILNKDLTTEPRPSH